MLIPVILPNDYLSVTPCVYGKVVFNRRVGEFELEAEPISAVTSRYQREVVDHKLIALIEVLL
ncbi:hypothetical protein HI914_02938 [Erysiphe necator]|nr:hypothetical protein HI914_02938 [Erysiphe necator]